MQMKYHHKLATALVLAAIAGLSSAQGLTRAEVQTETYPVQPAVAGKTRAQVRAETAQAIRDGDILAPGDAGLTSAQEDPPAYAAQRALDAKALAAEGESVDPNTAPR
jgi:hypothetical protein